MAMRINSKTNNNSKKVNVIVERVNNNQVVVLDIDKCTINIQ